MAARSALIVLWRYQAILGHQASNLIGLGSALCHQAQIGFGGWLGYPVAATHLTVTKRMLGRFMASQIASASLASFLLLLTYGFTNCGAIIFTA